MRSSSAISLMRSSSVVVGGLGDEAVDLDGPGLGFQRVRVLERVGLVGAELVEVVVAGHVLERGERLVGGGERALGGLQRRGAGAGRRERGCQRGGAEARNAGEEVASAQVGVARCDLGWGDVGWAADQHGASLAQLTHRYAALWWCERGSGRPDAVVTPSEGALQPCTSSRPRIALISRAGEAWRVRRSGRGRLTRSGTRQRGCAAACASRRARIALDRGWRGCSRCCPYARLLFAAGRSGVTALPLGARKRDDEFDQAGSMPHVRMVAAAAGDLR